MKNNHSSNLRTMSASAILITVGIVGFGEQSASKHFLCSGSFEHHGKLQQRITQESSSSQERTVNPCFVGAHVKDKKSLLLTKYPMSSMALFDSHQTEDFPLINNGLLKNIPKSIRAPSTLGMRNPTSIWRKLFKIRHYKDSNMIELPSQTSSSIEMRTLHTKQPPHNMLAQHHILNTSPSWNIGNTDLHSSFQSLLSSLENAMVTAFKSSLTLQENVQEIRPNGMILKQPQQFHKSIPNRIVSHLVQSILNDRFFSKHSASKNVSIRVTPHGASGNDQHFLSRLFWKGNIKTDINVQFDEIHFPNIHVSGGGNLDVNSLNVDVLAMLFPPARPQQKKTMEHSNSRSFRKRFLSPFEFHAKDFVLTQGDILSSSCIRNGLQNLLRRILKQTGGWVNVEDVVVSSVNVLPSEKISCTGYTTTMFNTKVPFEVRSGLSCSEISSHILDFPGLEVAIGNPGVSLQVFVPVLPEINVDIGDNAKLESISVSGSQRCVTVSARATVTPEQQKRTVLLSKGGVSSRDDYYLPLARYACDAGRLLTNLGNFTM